MPASSSCHLFDHSDSQFIDNQAQGTSGARGGAIFATGTDTVVTVRRSSLVQNTASGGGSSGRGGGIHMGANSTLTLVNGTVSDNSAAGGLSAPGGGVSADGAIVTINNTTITGNSAGSTTTADTGGIAESDTSTITIRNSVIAGNSVNGTGGSPDCDGDIVSAGYNLVGDLDGCNGFVTMSTDLTGDSSTGSAVSPGIGALVDNGGGFSVDGTTIVALTHLPGGSSALIDAADPQASCASEDQRGEARPQDGDRDGAAVCDIGAIEVAVAGDGSDDGSGGGGSTGVMLLAFLTMLTRRRARPLRAAAG